MRRARRDLVRVGLFTLAATGLLMGSLLWIAGSRLLRPRDTYTVLFEESVSGLSAGANVQFQGVVVGRVRDIQLTADIPPRVAVRVDLEPGTQVRRDTLAALLGSIVTGIQYIELQGGSEAAGALPPGGFIHGDVTSLVDFRDRLARVTDLALSILSRLESDFFTEENAATVRQVAADLGLVAKRLSAATEALPAEETGQGIVRLIERVGTAADRVSLVFGDFYQRREGLYAGLGGALRELEAAIADARALLGSARAELGGAGGDGGGLFEELARASRRLAETLDLIEADPSVLVRGRAIPEREFDR
jgi:phospholipid/cholesterol/gamma-HCH transport system substrate-binding protein